MKRAGEGKIVNISSGAGLRPSLTSIQGYTTAKHAQIGLTKQLALELGPAGINVNSVAPGFIRSNPSTESQWAAYTPQKQASIRDGRFIQRDGHPFDIAHSVAFLCSPFSSPPPFSTRPLCRNWGLSESWSHVRGRLGFRPGVVCGRRREMRRHANSLLVVYIVQRLESMAQRFCPCYLALGPEMAGVSCRMARAM